MTVETLLVLNLIYLVVLLVFDLAREYDVYCELREARDQVRTERAYASKVADRYFESRNRWFLQGQLDKAPSEQRQ